MILFLFLLLSQKLTDTVGNNEIAIFYEGYPIVAGRTVQEIKLPERLVKLGYQRVKHVPKVPGTFFWGHTNFRIYQRKHIYNGKEIDARLFTVNTNSKGMITGVTWSDGTTGTLQERGELHLEPVKFAESLKEVRAERISVPLKDYPEHLWKALLAAEDARFFDHHGLDSKAIARSMLANVKAGKVVMGGSTITQQLIKNRDLTPKRTFSRKATEALRALILETQYDKEEILEAYLNHVYMGHYQGLAIHGFPSAARTYFSKNLSELTLAQAALLAGMVQGPNHYTPGKKSAKGIKRRNWVLSRMKKLGWITEKDYKKAASAKIVFKPTRPQREINPHFQSWLNEYLLKKKKSHFESHQGAIIYTSLDPYLQTQAEKSLKRFLDQLTKNNRRIPFLEGALVSMDLETGGILAYSSYSTRRDKRGFDRVRFAQRQPGSTVKPFVLLEAFNRSESPLYPGTLIRDNPYTLIRDGRKWSPENYDRKYHGTVSLRTALAQSYNVPFAKLGQVLGYENVADMFVKAGLHVTKPVPPSITLGAIETTPLELLEAYSAFFNQGKTIRPRPAFQIDKPSGRSLVKIKSKRRRVAKASSAYLVYDILKESMKNGTAKTACLQNSWSAGKTGTSSNYRDAWFAGAAGSVLTVVWIGRDDNKSIGLPSSGTSAILWKNYMNKIVLLRPQFVIKKPRSIRKCKVNPKTGLRVFGILPGYVNEIYRFGAAPPREKPWRSERSQIIH